MPVRIPNLHGEEANPLQQAIAVAADATGVHPSLVAIILSHVLEEIAEEVSRGALVRIPNFGLFATKTYSAAYNGLGRAIPAFSASRGFRNLTNLQSSRSNANDRALKSHRANHCVGDWHEDLDRYGVAMELQRETYWKQYRAAQSSSAWQLTQRQPLGNC